MRLESATQSSRAVALLAAALLAACAQAPERRGGPGTAIAANAATAPAVAATMTMLDIPAGRFVMGTEPERGFQNGHPPHAVTIGPFRMSATEVTFAQYDAFARATGRDLPPDESWGRGSRPVIHVAFDDAQAFIAWLSSGTSRRFRLPTEAEWEYAARAGSTSLYDWGDEVDHARVNNSVASGPDRFDFTAPVGRFPPNAFGLFDMLGNVWELVADCRHSSYEGAPADGSARLDGACDSRVARGGSWGSTSRGVQVAARAAAGEQFASMDLGFRLAEDAAR